MFDVTQLGEKIRFHRQRMGLTQTELAKRIVISFQAVSGWETGSTLPDIENLCRLAEVFGVSVDSLMKRESLDREEIMIAVDGGGTSAEFALFTSKGRILTVFQLPGTNASVIGVDAAYSIFCQGIDLCRSRCSFVKRVFIGNAGSKLDEISERLSQKYSGMSFTVVSDGVNALRSAEGDAALICGTGSIMLKAERGGYRFVGGWGYRIGDPGSAYSLGCDAIRAALAYRDGVSGDGTLCSMIQERYGESLLSEYWKKPVAEIAKLAGVVFEAYEAGNSVAEEILHKEMRSLAGQVNAILPDGGRLIACGGIMEHFHGFLFPILRQYVREGVTFVLPKLPPIYGACVACCEHYGIERGEDFEATFARAYENAEDA